MGAGKFPPPDTTYKRLFKILFITYNSVREAIFFFFFFNDHGQSQGKLTSQFCGTGLVHVLSNGPYVPSVLG